MQTVSGAALGRPQPRFGRHRTTTSNSRRTVTVRADASRKFGKGQMLEPERLNAGRQLGSGSFGECYRGSLVTEEGELLDVVLKRVKAKVQGADEMHEAEHMINVLASRAAGEAVAPFLGYAAVEQPSGRLTRGLWLVWEYQGDKTLAYYLKRRDCERALAADLGVEEAAAVPTAMRQIFECLLALHNVGIVHRDIKPANIVFDEGARRFRLIDLGAAACLRTGTNYKPAETILDPCYCPPEEYVLPTDAPHLADQGTRLRTVMTPVLWTQHRPDCFDTYSAGVVLMQLSLPFLRTTSSLRTFNGALARCNHDLEEWRLRSGLPARQTALLDANDGAGWELAASLLRPREVVNDELGGVKFLNTGRAPRLGAAAALKHPFIKQAGAAAPSPAPASGSAGRGRSGSGSGGRGSGRGGSAERGAATPAKKGGGLLGAWGALKGRVFDLEARVMQEATATEVQTTVVRQLRGDVAAGRASAAQLQREEAALQGMQRSLASSVKELNSVFGAARGFLSAVLGPGGSSKSGKQAAGGSASSSGGKGARGGSGGRSAPPSSPAAERRLPKWAAREVPLEQVDPAAARQLAASRRRSSAEGDAAEAEQLQPAEAAGAAVSGLMRFTGSALTGLASFAANLSEQMERSAAQAAAEAAAQKQAAADYLEALQELQPPLSSASLWEEVGVRLPDAPQYAALSLRKREQVFRAYVEVLAKAEASAQQKALAAFQELLVSAQVAADTAWPEFAAAHGQDSRFAALPSEAERRAAFDGFTGQLRAAREAAQRKEAAAAEAAARAAARAAQRLAEAQAAKERAAARAALKAAAAEAAEASFRQLLQEQEAAIAGGLEYPQAKRMLWADPRFDAVPEYRRKVLYAEYVAILDEAGLLAPEEQRAAAAAAAAAATSAAGQLGDIPEVAEDGASQEQLEFLRAEQARLKEEYAKMEAKLRSMEQRLQLGATAVAGLPQRAESAADGAVTFRFGDAPVPGAAQAGGKPQQVAVNGSKLAKK